MTAEMSKHHSIPGLTWGIKASFTRYVMNLPDGRYLDEGGAALVLPNLFFFPLADASGWDGRANIGVLRFAGRVLLTAHAGILSLELMDPWVEVTTQTAIMSVVDVDRPDARVRLVDLEWEDDHSAIAARLAAGSEQIFNAQYPAGTAMDPVQLVLTPSQ